MLLSYLKSLLKSMRHYCAHYPLASDKVLGYTLLQHLSASSPDTSVLLTADGIKKREVADKAALQLQLDISSSDQDD
ncbi:MAG: hypothetical protein IPP36_10275 [Nitrosomonadales bacterium]|nr:hypothetical protein [Nitrosomonadales bacterium]